MDQTTISELIEKRIYLAILQQYDRIGKYKFTLEEAIELDRIEKELSSIGKLEELKVEIGKIEFR